MAGLVANGSEDSPHKFNRDTSNAPGVRLSLPAFLRFYPPQGSVFAPDVIEYVSNTYPGVKERGGALQAPANAAWLIERELQTRRLPFNVWTPKQAIVKLPTSLSDIRGLRKIDPKTNIPLADFVTAYQKREAFRFAAHEGVIFNHPPGSGKSLTAMIWSLALPGLIVVVTGAKGRLQWQAQLNRYTTEKTALLVGAGHQATYEQVVSQQPLARADVKALAAALVGQHLWCSCGEIHRHELFQTVATPYIRKGKVPATFHLNARVYLPIGHHEIGPQRVRFDVVEPEIPEDVRFLITGWETLIYHADKIVKLKPMSLVLDESHTAKNHRQVEMVPVSEADLSKEPKAKQLPDGRWIKYVGLENMAEATFKIAKASKRRALLTATFVKDRVRDAWAQLNYAEPWAWGSYWTWAKRYAGAQKNTWGGMDDRGATNLDELNSRVAFIRSVVSIEESHASLPAKRREVLYLAPDAQQAPDEGFAEEIAAARVARASLTSLANIRLAEACSRKRKAVIDMACEAVNGGSNVVVFTARRADVEVFRKIIKQPGEKGGRLGKNCWARYMSGEHSFAERHEAAQEYMTRAGHSLFVVTGGAFGEQIDLHNSDLEILAMLPFTLAELVQWEGRGHRLGGRPCLFIYVIAEGTADERVVSILLDKLPAIEKTGMSGLDNIRAALAGNEEELLKALAEQIVAGDHGDIVGIADGE